MAEFWRIGSCLVMAEYCSGMTTLQCPERFVETVVVGRLRHLTSNDESGLLCVVGSGTLYLVSPARVDFGESVPVAVMDAEPITAALTLSTLAVVYPKDNKHTLAVCSAVHGTDTTARNTVVLPADPSGEASYALGLLVDRTHATVLVACGDGMRLYRVSQSFSISAWLRVDCGDVSTESAVHAVCPINDCGDICALVGDELRVRTEGTIVRVKAPAKIGRPLLSVIPISGGLAVLGPSGVWGISFDVHETTRMWGKRFVRQCDGRHGLITTDDGCGVVVWRSNDAITLRLGSSGFE